MGFMTDNDKTSDIIEPGTYETLIYSSKIENTKISGAKYINICCVIRNDVEQEFKDRFVFHKIWKRDYGLSPADRACEGFSASAVNKLSACANLPSGTHYKDVADFLGHLTNRPLKLEVVTDKDGKYTNVKELFETDVPDIKHSFKKGESAEDGGFEPIAEDVDDEDLPF